MDGLDESLSIPLPLGELTQEEAMSVAIVMKFSALLSFCGSCHIIYTLTSGSMRLKSSRTSLISDDLYHNSGRISSNGSNVVVANDSWLQWLCCAGLRKNPVFHSIYNRIMFTLSICNCFASVAFFVGTWAIPKDNVHNSSLWGNIGDTTTCNIQGFTIHVSMLAVAICTGFLCLQFLWIVKYDWSDEKLRKAELFMRGMLVVAVISGIPLIPLELYNTTVSFCWVQSYPVGCKTDCLRGGGKGFQVARSILGIVPMALSLTIVTFSLVFLYLTVRSQEKKMQRYSTRWVTESAAKSTRQVFWKAALLVVSYWCIWVPTIFRLLVWVHNFSSYSVVLFNSMFLPLGGFFNALIFSCFVPGKTNQCCLFFASSQNVLNQDSRDNEEQNGSDSLRISEGEVLSLSELLRTDLQYTESNTK